MATYNEDLSLLAFASVTPTDNANMGVDLGIVQASASVTLDEDLATRQDLALLAVASVTVTAVVRMSGDLLLLSAASITLDEEAANNDLMLLAIASLDVTLPVEDELEIILAYAQVTLEEALEEGGISSSGGVGAGVGPTVRVRPDGAPRMTPTTTKRRTYFGA